MSSVLVDYGNCTLTFKSGTSYVFNEATLREESVTTSITIRALIQTDTKSRIVAGEGLDIQHLQVKGRCVDPVSLPNSVGYPVEVPIVFDNGMSGKFNVMPDISSPYYDEVGLVGQPIHGLVTFTG